MPTYLYHLSKFLQQPYEEGAIFNPCCIDEVQKVNYLIGEVPKHCAVLFVYFVPHAELKCFQINSYI